MKPPKTLCPTCKLVHRDHAWCAKRTAERTRSQPAAPAPRAHPAHLHPDEAARARALLAKVHRAPPRPAPASAPKRDTGAARRALTLKDRFTRAYRALDAERTFDIESRRARTKAEREKAREKMARSRAYLERTQASRARLKRHVEATTGSPVKILRDAGATGQGAARVLSSIFDDVAKLAGKRHALTAWRQKRGAGAAKRKGKAERVSRAATFIERKRARGKLAPPRRAQGNLAEPLSEGTEPQGAPPERTTPRFREDFEGRQVALKERLEKRAAARAAESAGRYGNARRIWDGIPMGQPILVGHYSEKRHRRDLERADTNMRKSIEADKEAAELKRRAAHVGEHGISSDDPTAIAQLKEKLAKLEANQALYVATNKAVRSKDPRAALAAMGRKPETIDKLLSKDFAGRIGIPDYLLKNNGAEIRRTKQRIEGLEQHRATPAPAPQEIGGVRVYEEENRVRLDFGKKPPPEVIAHLKGHGFHWSPREKVWQRMSSTQAWYHAREAAAKMGAS